MSETQVDKIRSTLVAFAGDCFGRPPERPVEDAPDGTEIISIAEKRQSENKVVTLGITFAQRKGVKNYGESRSWNIWQPKGRGEH